MVNSDSAGELQLNSSQEEAVNWNEGPLLVLAGPGSGKTTVLTQRIIRLIKQNPDERYRILALTFTQNAARNMRDKIDRIISEGRDRAYLTTFHSFCADIIRQHGELENIKSDFSIMTMDLDREELLLEVINESIQTGHNLKKEDIRYLPKINSFIEQCIILEAEPIPDSDINTAKYLYYHYLSKMRTTGRIDYSGILYFAWLLLGKKQIVKHYSVVYKYICVDEYQDTNIAQYNVLTRLLKSVEPNIFLVADDDQIVYQWNGASPERLNQIITAYNIKIIQLPENYRCPAEVVNIANKMIGHNRNRYEAKKPGVSLTRNGQMQAVTLMSFDLFSNEMEWIASDIKEKNRTPSNTKIMGRTRKLLEDAKELLGKNDVKTVIHQRKVEFESSPMRFLHSLLRLYISRGDKVQIQRLSSSFYQLEGINIDVHLVIGMASLTGGDLLKAWFKIANDRKEISVETRAYLSLFDFERYLIDHKELAMQTFLWLDKLSGLDSQNPESFDNYINEKDIWNLLVEDIRTTVATDLTLGGFLQELDLRDKSEPIPNDAIELITIHGAKGLEFQHVYLIGLVNDILPAYNSIKNGARPESLEEERRSCYVAITRTQKTLTLTYSGRYGNWQKQPSMFLSEMELL
ncbi:MAG: ATP-dependent helicase [Chlorobium sp.]|nr:ATP-dependent helicase [Chlorobium sp.]